MEDNTEKNKTPQEIIKNFISQLKRHCFWFIFVKFFMAILLCSLLAFIFIVFSNAIKWENLNEHYNLDANSTRLLWVIVIIDIVGLVWIVGSSLHQLKRYQSCIIRLNALQLKNSIKTSDSNKQFSEEEICKEVEEIVNDFCFGHNESDSTDGKTTDQKGSTPAAASKVAS